MQVFNGNCGTDKETTKNGDQPKMRSNSCKRRVADGGDSEVAVKTVGIAGAKDETRIGLQKMAIRMLHEWNHQRGTQNSVYHGQLKGWLRR